MEYFCWFPVEPLLSKLTVVIGSGQEVVSDDISASGESYSCPVLVAWCDTLYVVSHGSW